MDEELVYVLKNIDAAFLKENLFRGGAAWLSLENPFRIPIEDFIRRGDGYKLMLELIAKDALVLLYSVEPQAIYLSGRFTRIERFLSDVIKVLKRCTYGREHIVKLESRGRIAKEAAEEAAIIASGLAGGRYRKLVETLRLRESSVYNIL